jgi:maltose alpha-D-glucosyltransferase/alpha-amylase
MLDNDRRRLELAFSLLFTLPGTPMLQYGDEIGMGDDLSLPERECARTPMQWSDDINGGFSTARRPVRPVIDDSIYGYQRVNVEAQRRNSNSMLNWMERAIRMRRECPEISWGEWDILKTEAREVLAIRYEWDEHRVIALHNFSSKPRAISLDASKVKDQTLVNLLSREDSRANESGRHCIQLDAYGYRWYRAGGLDRNVARS